MRFTHLVTTFLLLLGIINQSISGSIVEAKSQQSVVTSNANANSGPHVEGKKNHHKKKGKKKQAKFRPLNINNLPADCCWLNEDTVSVRFFGVDRFADAFIQVVNDLNTMTAHMPGAPVFIFVDEPYRTCKQMQQNTPKWGVMICTVEPGENMWGQFAPAGFPNCCGSAVDGKSPPSRNGKNPPDGWYSNIFVENTDAGDITPDLVNSCGLDHNERCNGVYEGRFDIADHEIGHGLFALGHAVGSASSTKPEPGTKPFGPVDFERAELWWGESTVPYCTLYPQGYGCMP